MAELGDFEYEEGQVLPQSVQALDGGLVQIRGILLYLEDDKFLLVKELWGHHFGSPPDLHEAVVATIDPVVRPYEACPAIVEGTFSVGEEIEDGYVVSLYRLLVDRAEVDIEALDPQSSQACGDLPPYDRARANIAR